MKTSMWLVLLTVSLLGMLIVSIGGCGTVDYAPDLGPDGGGGGGSVDLAVAAGADLSGTAPVTVVGTWLSTGANLAPGFTQAPFNVMSISGVFNADATYTVTSTDSTGKMTTTSGTWTGTPSTVAGIFNLTQNQTQPSAATAQGIFQINAAAVPPLLTLEGIQTMPSVGATPPTAEGGFGSTMVNGMKTSNWIQKYVRQ